jgi:hypothetical protein
MAHRLDYGSIQVHWEDQPEGAGKSRVEVRARCVCGEALSGAGATFVEAVQALESDLARHEAGFGHFRRKD